MKQVPRPLEKCFSFINHEGYRKTSANAIVDKDSTRPGRCFYSYRYCSYRFHVIGVRFDELSIVESFQEKTLANLAIEMRADSESFSSYENC